MSTSTTMALADYQTIDTKECTSDIFRLNHQDPGVVVNYGKDTPPRLLEAVIKTLKKAVDSIELVRGLRPSGHTFVQGIFLKDRSGRVIAHIPNAVIGGEGSGPNLSRRVMEILGFSDETFQRVNLAGRAAKQHYYFIIKIG